MYWDGWWHMGWMWLVWLLFLAILVFLVWSIAASARGRESRPESPEEILKKRYARGDIEKEEFERKLQDMRR